MSIERLIVCPCEHDIDQHDHRGCLIRTSAGRCGCTRHRDAVLETLLNDPDAHVRTAAISMLEPVEADTSVRQVLSTVALSDQNSHIRNASRVVLRRVSEVQ